MINSTLIDSFISLIETISGGDIMKGIIADFTNYSDTRKAAAISDHLMRNLEENTIVLQMMNQKNQNVSVGYDDTKAPHFDEGVQYYRDQGYGVSIRNSGGRSVVNDEGILNFSLIYQSSESSEMAYLYFYQFLKDALAPLDLTIKFGEIKGAYCPGTFDISIDLQKVAGTAQRRVGNNTLVGCYLSVNGDQHARSTLISNFYKITRDIISVNPDKMTTLEDKIKRSITIDEVKTLLINHFKTITESTTLLDPTTYEDKDLQVALDRMQNQQNRFNL